MDQYYQQQHQKYQSYQQYQQENAFEWAGKHGRNQGWGNAYGIVGQAWNQSSMNKTSRNQWVGNGWHSQQRVIRNSWSNNAQIYAQSIMYPSWPYNNTQQNTPYISNNYHHPLSQSNSMPFTSYSPPPTNSAYNQYSQYVLDLPNINDPNTYTHCLFLQGLSQSYDAQHPAYNQPGPLIGYLLSVLDTPRCPVALSVLSFVASHIEHILSNTKEYELTHLRNIIRSKYPVQLDYSQEYAKVKIMDQGQANKMGELLGAIAVIVGSADDYARNRKQQQYGHQYQFMGNQRENCRGLHEYNYEYEYVEWVVNWVMVSLAQCIDNNNNNNNNNNDHNNSIMLSLCQHIQLNLHTLTYQLLPTILEPPDIQRSNQPSLSPSLHSKLLDILYLLLTQLSINNNNNTSTNTSYNSFNTTNTHRQHIRPQLILASVQCIMSICVNAHVRYLKSSILTQNKRIRDKDDKQIYDEVIDTLHQYFKWKLIAQIKSINKSNHNTNQQQCTQTRDNMFIKFTVKICKILELEIWAHRHKVQYLQMVTACQFVCDLRVGPNMSEDGLPREVKQAIEQVHQLTKQGRGKQKNKLQKLIIVNKNRNNNREHGEEVLPLDDSDDYW